MFIDLDGEPDDVEVDAIDDLVDDPVDDGPIGSSDAIEKEPINDNPLLVPKDLISEIEPETVLKDAANHIEQLENEDYLVNDQLIDDSLVRTWQRM